MKRLALVALALVFALALTAGILLFYTQRRPPKGPPVVVIIDPGMSVPAIALRLESVGVIVSSDYFTLLAKKRGMAARLRAGEFSLPRGEKPETVLDALVNGPMVKHRFTVPEGFTVRKIMDLFVTEGIATPAAMRVLENSSEFARSLGLPADSLEGYLFPDTYYYLRGASAKSLLGRMVERFREVFDARMRKRAEELGLSTHEVVTLASLIEEEAQQAGERAIISAVFHNRLKKGMRLQCDPTVIYGLGESYTGELRKIDLETATPYNTYRIDGLPPGPIGNPGRASLEAALWPADTPALYFVARNDGTHVFSVDYRNHVKAVNEYQRK